MASYLSDANRAWEALLTAHTVMFRRFAAESVWRDNDLSMREYDVLYTLSKCPDAARIGDLQDGVLLSQPALSRLVDRLAARGLVERATDPTDRRGVRVRLTEAGTALQQTVGRAHARSVSKALSNTLNRDEMNQLEQLVRKISNGS